MDTRFLQLGESSPSMKENPWVRVVRKKGFSGENLDFEKRTSMRVRCFSSPINAKRSRRKRVHELPIAFEKKAGALGIGATLP